MSGDLSAELEWSNDGGGRTTALRRIFQRDERAWLSTRHYGNTSTASCAYSIFMLQDPAYAGYDALMRRLCFASR